MTRRFSVVLGVALIGFAAFCHAQPTVTANCHILSGVQDESNLFAASTNYGFGFTNSTGKSFYLNDIALSSAVTLQGGGTFDPSENFTLNAPTQSNDGYSLGSRMAAGASFNWGNLFYHNGNFDSVDAPVGLYAFDAEFIGGKSPFDDSVVVDVPIELEIIHQFAGVEVSVAVPSTIEQGQTTSAYATLTNNMTSRNLVTSTWGIASDGNLSYNWAGDWWDKTIAPGTSLTGLHSTWTAGSDLAPGTYYESTFVLGGLYDGDNYWFGSYGNTAITVTAAPEPLTIVSLCAGFLGLVAARRRKKS
jgi:hypothetical protein